MATETELTLPALRGLEELANTRPILVQDTREQVPLVFTRLRCVRGTIGTARQKFISAANSFRQLLQQFLHPLDIAPKTVPDFAWKALRTSAAPPHIPRALPPTGPAGYQEHPGC
jgi:hypothetical protein